MRAVFLATILLVAAGSQARAGLDGCAIVRPTPDGFLSLRIGPGTRFAEKAKLRKGDHLWTTDKSCATVNGRETCIDASIWRHVNSVRRLDRGRDQTTEGWVYAKYLTQNDCFDDPENQPSPPAAHRR